MATLTVTEQNFTETIESNQIVLLDFWASWCGPCMQFGPIYEQVSTEHPNIVFGKIDTEAEQSLAGAANITSIPTLMALKNQTIVFSQAGALPKAALEDLSAQLEALDVEAALAAEGDQTATQADSQVDPQAGDTPAK
jgi:thioredoxin